MSESAPEFTGSQNLGEKEEKQKLLEGLQHIVESVVGSAGIFQTENDASRAVEGDPALRELLYDYERFQRLVEGLVVDWTQFSRDCDLKLRELMDENTATKEAYQYMDREAKRHLPSAK